MMKERVRRYFLSGSPPDFYQELSGTPPPDKCHPFYPACIISGVGKIRHLEVLPDKCKDYGNFRNLV